MKGLSLGSLQYKKESDIYVANFYDPLLKKNVYVGASKDKEVTNTLLNEHVYDFYYGKTFLLPKGIGVSNPRKSFTYSIRIRGEKKHIFISKSLKDVVEARVEFITSLL